MTCQDGQGEDDGQAESGAARTLDGKIEGARQR
jgi:hypothetical protein